MKNICIRCILVALLFSQFQFAFSQSEVINFKFRLYLKDKHPTEMQRTHPLTYLSQKAIDRRVEQGVEIDSTDYPISSIYKEAIAKLNVPIVAESKWFNTVVVQCEDSLQIREIEKLSFVDSVQFVWRGRIYEQKERMRPRLATMNSSSDTLLSNWFGVSAQQFEVHNAQAMLNAGFRGMGVDIAIIDGGFTNVDVIPLFAHSVIAGYKNFVPDGELFYAVDHGTRVLSTMAVNWPHKIMGSAPQASYFLLRSEDQKSEFLVEEDYWVAAAEYADSIGVRLTNTSLGYNKFDDPALSYTQKDLTGKHSIMSRAADMASDKGMIIVASAGNAGGGSWGKITVPGDSEKAITVGAIALDSTIASFSSKGPTADGRIKPDLVSIGRQTITINKNGKIGRTNGTSFSSPFLTGLIGSLWSVNPQLNRNKLIDIVRRSAHQFHNPDSIYGYGIPDFEIAYHEVLKTLKLETGSVSTGIMKVSKSKNNFLTITLNEAEFVPSSYSVRILDEKGNTIMIGQFESHEYIFELTKLIMKQNTELYIVTQSGKSKSIMRFRI